MKRTRCCHSCGARVAANSPRCTTCYVALAAAVRAPAPLRAGLSPRAMDGTAWAAGAVQQAAWDPAEVCCPDCAATVGPGAAPCTCDVEPAAAEAPVHDGWLAPVVRGPWVAGAH